MSKPLRSISLLALLTVSTIFANGQYIDATIEIDFKTPAMTSIRGRYASNAKHVNRRNLTFLQAVADIDNLASRVSDLQIFDSTGKPVAFKKLMDGEYLTDADFDSWQYKLDLTPPKNRNGAAHVSWFADGVGILMLADLLPRFDSKDRTTWARIRFNTPRTVDLYPSPIYSSETRRDDVFEVADFENAVFYVGSGWESGNSRTDPFPGGLIISSTWNFKAVEASQMAREINSFYLELFGANLSKPPLIAIAKFSEPVGFGHWVAETRGHNVTIISSDMPFKTQSLQRLHEQLRHELFHLWIPNGVNLTGNYDWFYEGFALYQSLKLAVALNRIRFEDFLDTLSRAHTIDSAQLQRMSLLQSSAARFSGANTQVYARGMLVAFLCDLALLERSRGKRSVENILEEVFAKHRPPAAEADGNTAVLSILKANALLIPIVEKYVTGAERIEWTTDLAAAGIEDADAGPITTLRVKQKPSGRQKTLLEHLGYNNWRKLSPRSR
jgi:hypothetical protein